MKDLFAWNHLKIEVNKRLCNVDSLDTVEREIIHDIYTLLERGYIEQMIYALHIFINGISVLNCFCVKYDLIGPHSLYSEDFGSVLWSRYKSFMLIKLELLFGQICIMVRWPTVGWFLKQTYCIFSINSFYC